MAALNPTSARPIVINEQRPDPSFFRMDTLSVARGLLGMELVTRRGDLLTAGRIVEVEAYQGADDAASHAFKGKTERNAPMFGVGGLCYVYFIYGVHYCVNIVTGSADTGSAVLIRALEPLEGIETMKLRRQVDKLEQLTSGPGKLCQALDIGPDLQGMDLTTSSLIYIRSGTPIRDSSIVASKRIGISKAVDYEWRFFVKENAFVSKKT